MEVVEQGEGVKITFRDFVTKYVRYLPLFILSAGICLALAYLYLRYATPIYNARATILIKSEKNPYGASNEEFESIFLFKGGSDVDNEIEILQSKNIATRVAKSLGLQKMYYTIGNVKTSLSYPLSPFQIDVIKLTDTVDNTKLIIKFVSATEFKVGDDDNSKTYRINKPFSVVGGTFILRKSETLFDQLQYKDYQVVLSSEESAADFVLKGLKVNPIKDRSNVLLLSFQGVQLELSKDILNRIMEEYRASSIEDKNQIAIQTSNFINKRLDIIGDELGDVEKNLQNFKQKNQVINPQAQSEIFLNNQSDIEKELTQREIQLSIIQYLQEYVNDESNRNSIVPSSLGIPDPVFMQLVKSYNELQLRRETELKTTTPNNPIIIALAAQIDKVRLDMKENLKNLSLSNKILRDQSRKKIDAFQSNLSTIPVKEKNLLDITRQQGIKQSLYLFLLQKREETAISLASTISNSQVLDVATGSRQPVKPDPFGIKAIAIFIGLLIPLLIIYLRELLNDKLSSRLDITKSTQTPIFGEIAHSDDPQTLVMTRNSRKVISEQFRMIRTNLSYLVGTKEHPVILVTSTVSGEGKSFISINAAAVMALAGKRTIILELDIRKPKILAGLGIPRSQGITNYLVGDQDLSSIVVSVPQVENLFVMPCGPIPPNPAEMLLEDKLKDVFDYATKHFDIVIVDTAPVGLVSDAQVLSRFADCTFYITRLNYTMKKHIHFINDLYLNQKLPKIALLVNDIKATSDYYSYGNYNGYGYGYSYFDEESVRNRSWFQKLFRKRKAKNHRSLDS